MANDATGIGTSAEVSAPGWEIRYFEDLAKRLPSCVMCGGKMRVVTRPPKKPKIVCDAAGCARKGLVVQREDWEVKNV